MTKRETASAFTTPEGEAFASLGRPALSPATVTIGSLGFAILNREPKHLPTPLHRRPTTRAPRSAEDLGHARRLLRLGPAIDGSGLLHTPLHGERSGLIGRRQMSKTLDALASHQTIVAATAPHQADRLQAIAGEA